ncbi:MAG: DUF4342 domain-containing protein [Anaerovoracaceae bacterium]|nr:DUF4342 domain-containing protein [Anaerovoracaceae bacterium]
MEITLEKIELVKDRTGVTYKEAKEALEASDGSVVDAIISIEENIDGGVRGDAGAQGAAIVNAIGEAVRKGNVSKIVVKNQEDEILLNLPVNAGVIGALVAPWGVVAGIVAAFGFKCVVEIVKDDGTIVDISRTVNEKIDQGVEKGSEIAGTLKDKGSQIYSDIVSGDAKDRAQEFAGRAVDRAQDIASDAKDRFDSRTDDLKDKAEDLADDAGNRFDDIAGGIKEAADEIKDRAKEAADGLKARTGEKVEDLGDGTADAPEEESEDLNDGEEN